MHRVFNFVMFFLIIIFIFSVFKYYSSNKNVEIKTFNRSNIDQILKDKIVDLPTLSNDTDNVIEFNNSLENEKFKGKKRSFWNLLKNK